MFAKPVAAAVLLFINGLILLVAGERLRRRQPQAGMASPGTPSRTGKRRRRRRGEPRPAAAPSDRGRRRRGCAMRRHPPRSVDSSTPSSSGPCRSAPCSPASAGPGSPWSAGLWRGLDHEDAARFGFLLATPVILAAGVLKLPSLAGPAGAHIHGQVLMGVVVAGVAAYLSVRFLMRYFQTRTLTPFAIYCVVFGAASIFHFA